MATKKTISTPVSALASQSIESMRSDLTGKREELRVFRFGAAGSRARNVRAGRMIRRDIARLETELRMREIVAQKATPVAISEKN